MRNVIIILIASIVGVFVSCRTSESITSSTTTYNASDSVVVKEIVKVDTIQIPGDSILVHVPIFQLKHDTIIRYRSKTASIELAVDNGQLKATAQCDSLEKLVLSYEKSLTSYTAKESTKETSEKQKIVPWYFKAGFWILASVAITIMYLLKKLLI